MANSGHVQVGHPVDVGSGAVFTAMDDFVLDGTLPLAWSRFYSTDATIDSWLGRGWVVPWFMSLTRVDDGYLLVEEQGRSLLFPFDAPEQMPVGTRLLNYGANMALLRSPERFVVEHWHHGTDDVEWFCFDDAQGAHMPLAWLQNVHGHRIKVQHDEHGRPVRLIQEIEERVIELSYESGDLIDTVQMLTTHGDRLLLARYEYDTQRRLVAACDALGNRTTYAYDSRHRMVRETNALGASFHFEYDSHDRCIHTYGDGGYMERWLQYLSAPHTTKVTDGAGYLSTYVLNAAGQVIQETSPLGAITTTEFDQYGRPVSMRNPLGGQVHYEYDAAGNRSAVIHEDGGRSEMTHNAVHLLQCYTSPGGAQWAYDFGPRGEVIGFTNPMGERSACIRDQRGLVVESRSPTGVTVRRRYGPALRWAEAYDAVSLLSRTEYNERGDQTAIFDAQGLVQRITYDALGRPVSAEDRLGRVYSMAWNALGELAELSGPDISWERRTYDGFGQLVQHDNPLGSMQIAYDKEGRMVRVRNRMGEDLSWDYDADGWLVQETGFDGRVERYEYDMAGRPVRVIRSDGRAITQTFDACAQVVRRELSKDDVVEFAYDADGALIKAKNRCAEVVLERNRSGRVVAEVQSGRRIQYAHDADGDRVARRVEIDGGLEVRLAHDARKRVISLADETGIRVELGWDEVNRPVERRFAGRVRERLVYDTIGRLREQAVSSPQAEAQIERRYEYDAADNLVARADARHGRSAFSHDEIGRLTTVIADGQLSESYGYDANGGIRQTHRGQRVLAPGGRTLQEGPTRYAYGADGCLREIDIGGRTTRFEHSMEGQLTRTVWPDGKVACYEYDPFGRRTAKEVDGIRVEFLWDGPVLAAEITPGEQTESHYVLGFEPLIQWRGRKAMFPVRDQSGMVREVIDDRGTTVWRGTFEAYGAPQSESGKRASPFAFRGQYVDGESGLNYNFFRSYSPVLCDYTSPDPIGIEGGSHFYGYPRSPLRYDDPFGLKCGGAKCGEKSMDGYFGQKGYKKVGAIGKKPSANGIDAIYYKPGGKPPYIIAEAKNGGGYLHTDVHGNVQMSDAWINSAPGKTSKSRLDGAFPAGSTHPADIRAASANGDVHTAVYSPDKDPKVTHYGTYGGPLSTDKNAPPRPP